jgi:hypothetical protein
MKPRHLLLIGSLAAIAVSIVTTSMAFANDRYATQPPVRVDNETSQRWIAQLNGPAVRILPQLDATESQKRAIVRQKQPQKPRYQNVKSAAPCRQSGKGCAQEAAT